MKLSRITSYPVKSLNGSDLAIASVEKMGVAGDRRWAVVHNNGKLATRRDLPALASLNAVDTDYGISISFDGERFDVPFPSDAQTEVTLFKEVISNLQDAGNYAAHFLSSALKREVRLVYFPDAAKRNVDKVYAPDGHTTGLSDGFPILLATTPSLHELNAELERPVEMRRFRPNLVVNGDFEPWAEDTWKRIKIGSVILRRVKPCERCVMILQDPLTGEQTDDREPMATLRRLHRSSIGKTIFGQNMVVEQTGTLVLGDQVEVLERAQSNLYDYQD